MPPFEQKGMGDMGSVSNRSSVCRYFLPGIRYGIESIKVDFSSGTGSADLTIQIDDGRSEAFDRTEYTFIDAGTDGVDVSFRVEESERRAWEYEAGDVVVLNWTNPDADTMNWVATVKLRDAQN